MKIFKKWGFIALVACMAITLNINKTKAQTGIQVSFQTFYNELAPYGHWINEPGYGNAWIPDAAPDFQPYATAGHWEVTEYGNTWVSDYPWGWAPFHYGRWTLDNVYGWIWIPGYEWGPSWVAWRSGGGYYGWAPLPPGVNIGISINIPLSRWFFVPDRYFTSPRLYSYYVPRPRVVTIYRSSRFLGDYYERNNHRYFYGPRTGEIERATGRPVVIHHTNRNTPRPVRSNDTYRNRPGKSAGNPNDNWNNNNKRPAGTQRNPATGINQRPERRTEAPDIRTQDNNHSLQQAERPQRQNQRVEQRPAVQSSNPQAQQQQSSRPARRVESPDTRTQDNNHFRQQAEQPQRQNQPQQRQVEQRPAAQPSNAPSQRQQPQRQESSRSSSSSGRPTRR